MNSTTESGVEIVKHSHPQTQYLVRSMRHTHNKDYENYVVTGIWHRLRMRGLDIEIVTQQYVKRQKGYALLDLYFPALHLAVECDEKYHLGNKINDKKREEDVFKAFEDCEFDKKHSESEIKDDDAAINAESFNARGLKLARVDASVPYWLIDKQLDDIVAKVEGLYKKIGAPAWDVRPVEEKVRESGCLSVGCVFNTIPAILECLNIHVRRWWSGGYPRNSKNHVLLWFPHLSVNSGKWQNILIREGEKIIIEESRPTDKGVGRDVERNWGYDIETLKNDKLKRSVRVVFAHGKNALGEAGYRFIGVFKLCGAKWLDEGRTPVSLNWERVADRIEIKDTWQDFVAHARNFG